MFDSVNLNSLVSSSSLIKYNQLLGNEGIKVKKNIEVNKTFESNDVEGVLSLQDTNSVNNSNKQKVNALVDKLNENFSKEVEFNISYQIAQLANVDWESDVQVEQYQEVMKQDIASYKSIINSAVDKFISSYSGDGSDIDEQFAIFIQNEIVNNTDLNTLVQKYNNESILAEQQKKYDEAVNALKQIESSWKNDKDTQAKKQYYQMLISNAKLFIDKAPATTGGINTNIDTDLYSIENIFAEVSSTVDWEKFDIEQYRSNPKFIQAQEMIAQLKYESDPDSVINSVKTLLINMLQEK